MSTIRASRSLQALVAAALSAAIVPNIARAAEPTMSECLAANENAIALRRDHKLRSARAQSLTCASVSCPGEVRDVCQNRVRELSEAIPTVVFFAKDSAGHDLVHVRVSMDGETIGERLDGTSLPVDPGQHSFAFDAAGAPRVQEWLVIGEGEKDRRETVVFGAGPAGTAAGEGTAPAQRANPTAPAPSEPPGSLAPLRAPGHVQRIAGYAGIGVGAVGVGVGIVAGLLATATWASAKSDCSGKPSSCTTDPTSQGFKNERSASTMATVSDVGFIAGGILAAAGAVVLWTAPKRSTLDPRAAQEIEIVPWAGARDTGLLLRGAF